MSGDRSTPISSTHDHSRRHDHQRPAALSRRATAARWISRAMSTIGGALLATSGGLLDIESAIGGGTATIAHGTLGIRRVVERRRDVRQRHSGTDYGVLVLNDSAGFLRQDFQLYRHVRRQRAFGCHRSDGDRFLFRRVQDQCYNASTGILTHHRSAMHTAYLNFDDFDRHFISSDTGNSTARHRNLRSAGRRRQAGATDGDDRQ